eukprot:CAMPEP_0197824008 /NCGR_PEP_ID=MMETSP1437-20131217/1326_1 /TAXON_ID=49252 ORGANISM="Eucampia antarctica, Strain CCMP1452" /NCGR_SAMPLE_ID=MMETSP1437 /ASSEMBLY_ACC=CAM_ASM_001096 /LENGTH=165 /DNA_ID=CAMNT_0043423471 /DNA_START=63 /DNA_END=560 /DNA_ORIENTATION=+
MTAQQCSKPSKASAIFRRSKHGNEKILPYQNASADAPWNIENILNDGPPKTEDWWEIRHSKEETDVNTCETEKESDTSVEDPMIAEDSESVGNFQNVGLIHWKLARQAWRVCTVETRPPHPPPVRYDEVVRGLCQVQRTYELPGAMTLPDIISIFGDIWDCESDI